MSLLSKFRRLLRNRSGVAMTEFALGAPFLLTAGLWGIETANFALVNMKIGQLAVHVADNASRIGDTSVLDKRPIYEEDIIDLLLGANIQAGPKIDLYEHGRVIVTSVEIFNQSRHNATTFSNGTQFAHWQRCKGALVQSSQYATAGQRLNQGIGPVGRRVDALDGSPVMFVEIYYKYQPMISSRFIGNTTILTTAAFLVRDDRDVERVHERSAATAEAACNVYDSFPAT